MCQDRAPRTDWKIRSTALRILLSCGALANHRSVDSGDARMAAAFQLEELPGAIAQLTLDLPGKKVNTLGQAVLAELMQVVTQLEKRSDLKGLLFRSGKPDQFIAGADLNELGALAYATPEQIERGLAFGHDLFSRISRLPFPTVALIDGNCMGGGTE